MSVVWELGKVWKQNKVQTFSEALSPTVIPPSPSNFHPPSSLAKENTFRLKVLDLLLLKIHSLVSFCLYFFFYNMGKGRVFWENLKPDIKLKQKNWSFKLRKLRKNPFQINPLILYFSRQQSIYLLICLLLNSIILEASNQFKLEIQMHCRMVKVWK